jgi:4-aminobutyrate aminotransferase-like enzyme
MAMFCCTGSEANELALRIARDCSGGLGVISTAWAYHGNTAAVMQVSSLFTPEDKRGPNVRTVPVMDPYRERAGRSDEELATAYADEVKRAIDSFKAAGIGFAGLLFCTAFSSEGLPTVPAGFMAKALAHVHAAGGFFIADEVQAGFGRLGSHMWGHQKLGVIPDIVTLGKPMGNGHPLAGVVARRDLVEGFTSRNMYFNTFGGNPVSAAVGMAVLDAIEDESLLENAVTVGNYTLERLSKLADRHELIGDVRGAGMFFAVELVSDRKAKTPATAQTKRLVNLMRERGVLISRIGIHDNILKIRPPMTFSKQHADLLIETLDGVLAAL